ncbi:glycosyltransferase family 4 protein [Halalkalibaculum sp. DA3122]|uniref:glycosyltransferase family 4 protein n=1 Tax=unclassified Halalkalibaculum TaxID=2964617 RepID=UPI003754E0F5
MSERALIVTYYWPPSGGAGVQRPLKFAKYLPQFDIQPFVLTVENPTYPIRDESLESDIPEEVEVFKSNTIEPFSLYSRLVGKSVADSTKPTIQLKSGSWSAKLSAWIRANIFLPDARAGWLLSARSSALSIVEEHDIGTIITTGPPHSVHFTGKHVKERTGIRWIADFRDPWTGVYYNKLMPRTSLARHIDEKLEKSILQNADEVVVISDSMVDIQRKIIDRTYHVIPNGFDPDDFQPGNFKPENRSESQLTIRFVGSVRDGAIPDGFLRALARLKNPGKYRMEFIGNHHPSLREWVDELDLRDVVELKPYVPHEEAIRAMCTADLLLLSISKTPGSELILTGKLFEYLGSGTPILFLGTVNGDAAQIIRKAGQGVCFEHHQVPEITEFLEHYSRSEAQAYKQPQGQKEHPFSRLRLTRQLGELISNR